MNWKEEFMQLYMSDSATDVREALDLKRKHIPERLFRYRSLSDDKKIMGYRYDEIVKGEIYLSLPKELNDPFEGCSLLSSCDPSFYFYGKKSTYAERFTGIIPGDKHEEIFSSDNWYDALITYVAEATVGEEDAKQGKDALRKSILLGMEELNSHLCSTTKNMVRVACFSTTATNLPMWNHYTSHKGICLEYDTKLIKDAYQKNMLFPVKYVDKLPDVISMMMHEIHPRFNLFEYIAMHKLKDWSYENEWRLLHDIGSFHYRIEDVPDDFFTSGKTIQFICPSKIIMGLKISKQHREAVEEMATSAGIPVVQAKQTEYGLNVTEKEE